VIRDFWIEVKDTPGAVLSSVGCQLIGVFVIIKEKVTGIEVGGGCGVFGWRDGGEG
jgi:hypothetical protein